MDTTLYARAIEFSALHVAQALTRLGELVGLETSGEHPLEHGFVRAPRAESFSDDGDWKYPQDSWNWTYGEDSARVSSPEGWFIRVSITGNRVQTTYEVSDELAELIRQDAEAPIQ